MKKTLLLATLLIFTSCSSALKEKVLVRSDDLDERPSWAQTETTMFIKEGRIYVVGLAEHDVNSRIPAVARIADNNARFEISRQITDDLAYIFQNMEEGVSEGADLSRFYASEISKHMAHGIRQEKRYWEKLQTFDAEGEKALKLRVYSLASIKESDLKRAISDVMNKDNKLDPRLKEQINNHISREIEKLGQN
ncbi:MAG: hypothetical protein OHK0056_25130 [Bacteriovoracaceae bacterium]